MTLLTPGTLQHLALQTTQAALASGALQPIATRCDRFDDSGIPFLVRQADSLRRKDQAQLHRRATPAAAAFNPFLPYDPELFVADLSSTHLVLLNKFNVMDHHLLLVTRQFEAQDTLLTAADFEAMWIALGEIDGLAFYNGGKVAGASQRHRHLQLIPLPMAAWSPTVPIAAALTALAAAPAPQRMAGLPFAHGIVPLDHRWALSPRDAGQKTLALYFQLLESVGLETIESGSTATTQDRPTRDRRLAKGGYNLLATRHWMMLVPRWTEAFEGIAVNSLGFAGSMFVRNQAELARIKAIGPMKILQTVSQVEGG